MMIVYKLVRSHLFNDPYSRDFLSVNFVMFLHCKTFKKCDFFGRASRANGVPYFHDFLENLNFYGVPY